MKSLTHIMVALLVASSSAAMVGCGGAKTISSGLPDAAAKTAILDSIHGEITQEDDTIKEVKWFDVLVNREDLTIKSGTLDYRGKKTGPPESTTHKKGTVAACRFQFFVETHNPPSPLNDKRDVLTNNKGKLYGDLVFMVRSGVVENFYPTKSWDALQMEQLYVDPSELFDD